MSEKTKNMKKALTMRLKAKKSANKEEPNKQNIPPTIKAKKKAYQLKIDMGKDLGIKKTSAQITERYTKEELIGKQVLAVVNFPPRQIADYMSEILVLGTYSKQGVVLIKPDEKVENGDKLG